MTAFGGSAFAIEIDHGSWISLTFAVCWIRRAPWETTVTEHAQGKTVLTFDDLAIPCANPIIRIALHDFTRISLFLAVKYTVSAPPVR